MCRKSIKPGERQPLGLRKIVPVRKKEGEKMMRWQQGLLALLLSFGLLLAAENTALAALVEGDVVPRSNRTALAKVGSEAPSLELLDLTEQEMPVEFKGKRTVLLALNRLDDFEKLKQLNLLYEQRKNEIQFFCIMRNGAEQIKTVWASQNLTLPVRLQRSSEFFKKYNAAAPALVLVDAQGIVQYNGEWQVDLTSLEHYLEQHRPAPAVEDPPALTYAPKRKFHNDAVPVLLKIGDVVKTDDFHGLAQNPVHLRFEGRPIVLFLWMNFTPRKALDEMMPLMQQVAADMGAKANVYTLNGSKDDKALMRLLARYDNQVPVLRGGHFLQYARKFPAVVVIDGAGRIRYRPDQLPTVAELERVLKDMENH